MQWHLICSRDEPLVSVPSQERGTDPFSRERLNHEVRHFERGQNFYAVKMRQSRNVNGYCQVNSMVVFAPCST